VSLHIFDLFTVAYQICWRRIGHWLTKLPFL